MRPWRSSRETVGDEVPTLGEVRDKIERRLAAAQATTDLSGASTNVRVLEVEQAQLQAEAHARLAQLRSQLGLENLLPSGDEPGATTPSASST